MKLAVIVNLKSRCGRDAVSTQLLRVLIIRANHRLSRGANANPLNLLAADELISEVGPAVREPSMQITSTTPAITRVRAPTAICQARCACIVARPTPLHLKKSRVPQAVVSGLPPRHLPSWWRPQTLSPTSATFKPVWTMPPPWRLWHAAPGWVRTLLSRCRTCANFHGLISGASVLAQQFGRHMRHHHLFASWLLRHAMCWKCWECVTVVDSTECRII